MINPVLPKNHGMNQIEIISCGGLCDTSLECNFCGSKFLLKKGKYRKCKNCGKTFIHPDHRVRQTFPKDQRFAGVSTHWMEDNSSVKPWKREMKHEDNVVVRRGGD